jgi:pimeloyl-ACP methyl ester carboxylesterase
VFAQLHQMLAQSSLSGGTLHIARDGNDQDRRQSVGRRLASRETGLTKDAERAAIMTNHIGRVVIGCLTAGLVVALGLVLGPLGGAQEHVITGAVLLAFAASWASLAALSILWTDQPQRWAAMPAGFLAIAGAGLLTFAPDDVVIDALGWIWPPLLLALLAATVVGVRVNLHSRTRTWVVYPLLGVYALCAVGGGYQTLRESLDRRTNPAPGQLIDVGGHRLHLNCVGSGSPTVILESGLGEPAAYWKLISTAVVHETRVCAYDRAGRGWSEPAPDQQDGVAVARDLRVLLERGHVPAPFVLVGHSSGAQYVRIFAGRYPEQVAGMVLLDGQPAEAFEGLPNYPLLHGVFRRVFALLPSLARLGVGRILSHADWSARVARSLRDEFAELPTSLAQARSFQSIGDRPLVVVTATRDALAGWLPLQDAMATLSTNSSHRVVPYTHDALITDQTAAQTSIDAIRDVVHAARFATALKKS